jgi:uncharacterized membrane protein YvlD (DUF360 family)
MNYIKTFVVNFLVIFLANHILPGIYVLDQTKLPHVGGDVMMAAVLGLLNTLIYPILKLSNHASLIKVALVALVLNFAAYAALKLIPVGISVASVEGYFLAAVIVTIGSFITNFLEYKRQKKTEIPL